MRRVKALLPTEPVPCWLHAEKGTPLPREPHAHSGPREGADTWEETRFPRRRARRLETFPWGTEDGCRPPGDEEEPDSGYQFQFQIWPGASEVHRADGCESHTSDRQSARNQGERVRRGHPWL